MYQNQSQVSDLYAILAATNEKEKVVFANYYFCWWQQNFGSNREKLRPRRRATLLRICEWNTSFNEWV